MDALVLILLTVLIGGCGNADLGAAVESASPSAGEAPTESVTPQAAVVNTGATVAADAGFIADGGTISVPTGFTAAQCVFTTALASVSGKSLSTRTLVNSSGAVTCKALVEEQTGRAATEKSCTASFTVICAK